MHHQDIAKASGALKIIHPTTIAVLQYVLDKGGVVTTPMLIAAGVVAGKQVNHVRAAVMLLNWALLYPCGRTYRWWVTDEGRDAVKRSQRSL